MKMAPITALFMLLMTAAPPAAAESVRLTHQGRVLNGIYQERQSGAGGIVLLVHDTLSHAADPTMTALREALAASGLATLAVNLGLGVDDRRGPYDCTVPHRHRHDDAVGEIAAWLDWLAARGQGPVTLLDHGRGGNQVAWFLATRDTAHVANAVLLGPPTWDLERAADAYKAQHGRALIPVLGPIMLMVKLGQGDRVIADVPFLDCAHAAVAAKPFLTYYSDDEFLDTPNLLARAGKPVLVLHGAEDETLGDLAAKLAKLDNPRVNSHELPDSGHALRPEGARTTAREIRKFLAR